MCNPLFAERLVRATEVVSQTPSGWSQAIILELLRAWGTEGYLQWLSNLRSSYTVRRNWMVWFPVTHPSSRLICLLILLSVMLSESTLISNRRLAVWRRMDT